MIIKRIICFMLTAIFMVGGYSFKPDQAQEQEYILKAAFLYRFVDYVEWGSNDDETFNIAILGESDIVAPLVSIARDKKAKNKRIVIRQYTNVGDVGSCQMIFVSRSYRLPIESVMARSDFKPVLVITENEEDFNKGSQMNFLITDNKLKFEVNLNAVTRAGLKISSQLLQHAYIIKR